MNKTISRLLIIFIFIGLFYPHSIYSQQAAFGQSIITNFKNNPLPKNPQSLKILGIGNSFTDDGMAYLPDLLKHAGITNVTLGRVMLGGSSLEKHYQIYTSGEKTYERYEKSYPGKNVWEEAKKPCGLLEAVTDEDWDIIVIQQVSHFSGMYETYQPYLNNLINIIVTNCSNAGVTLAWQMTWSYGRESNHGGFANYDRDQTKMYQTIVETTKRMITETGIDIIIPSGTAIQNIRATEVNNPPRDLTRDGFHIDFGVGRYVLACTWFQSLVAPCLNTSVSGNTFRVTQGNIHVTDDNAKMCQDAAKYACSQRFSPVFSDK